MLSIPARRRLARERLKDSRVLHAAKRYDGSQYLCGDAVEIALKARICRTLRGTGFPETSGEFKDLASLKSHNLEILLKLSGYDARVRSVQHGPSWSVVCQWNPEIRYRAAGFATQASARSMIESTADLLKLLLPR